jgi:hypothetical protein
MARKRDFLPASDIIVHTWNEGVRQEQIFRSSQDYELLLNLILQARRLAGVSVIIYALTPYRFDLVVLQHRPHTLSAFMKYVCNNYSRLINQQMGRRGHSFLRRYSGKPVPDSTDLLLLSHGLHVLAVDKGLVETPEAWPYSSCRGYLDSCGTSVVDHSLVWGLVGGREQYKEFLREFNPADPGSIHGFLCQDADSIWGERGKITTHR